MKSFNSINEDLDRLTVICIVEHVAQKSCAITYGELAERVGAKRGRKMHPVAFADALGRIQEYCTNLSLPTLPAVVINKMNLPGGGFAPVYRDLHPETADLTDIEIVHMEQLEVFGCKDWKKLYKYMGIEKAVPVFKFVDAEQEAEKLLEEGRRVSTGIREELVRNPEARRRCLAAKGYTCFVCEKSIEEEYGISGIVHVHHLSPLAESDGARRVDPIGDLVPVCPNCHAVIHSRSNPCYAPNEVRQKIGKKPLPNYDKLI